MYVYSIILFFLVQEIGKCIKPDTIRAIFGETKICNSIHVTDLMEDRIRDVSMDFEV